MLAMWSNFRPTNESWIENIKPGGWIGDIIPDETEICRKSFSGQDEDEQKNSSKHPAVEKNDPETSNGSSDCYQRMQTLKGECLRFRKEQLQDMPPPQKW